MNVKVRMSHPLTLKPATLCGTRDSRRARSDCSLGTYPERKKKNSTFPSRKQQLVPDVVHFLVNTWGTASKMNAGEVCMCSGVCAGLSNQTVYCAKNDGHACKSL